MRRPSYLQAVFCIISGVSKWSIHCNLFFLFCLVLFLFLFFFHMLSSQKHCNTWLFRLRTRDVSSAEKEWTRHSLFSLFLLFLSQMNKENNSNNKNKISNKKKFNFRLVKNEPSLTLAMKFLCYFVWWICFLRPVHCVSVFTTGNCK